jgi:hypothetical protein
MSTREREESKKRRKYYNERGKGKDKMIMNFDDAETESLIYVIVVFLTVYSEG